MPPVVATRVATARGLLEEVNGPLAKFIEQLEISERIGGELSDRVQILEREKFELQQQARTLTSEKEALVKTNVTLNEHVSELETSNDELKRSNESLKTELEQLKAASTKRVEELERREGSLQHLNTQLAQRFEGLEEEKANLEARLKNLEGSQQPSDVSGDGNQSERADGFVTAIEDVQMNGDGKEMTQADEANASKENEESAPQEQQISALPQSALTANNGSPPRVHTPARDVQGHGNAHPSPDFSIASSITLACDTITQNKHALRQAIGQMGVTNPLRRSVSPTPGEMLPPPLPSRVTKKKATKTVESSPDVLSGPTYVLPATTIEAQDQPRMKKLKAHVTRSGAKVRLFGIRESADVPRKPPTPIDFDDPDTIVCAHRRTKTAHFKSPVATFFSPEPAADSEDEEVDEEAQSEEEEEEEEEEDMAPPPTKRRARASSVDTTTEDLDPLQLKPLRFKQYKPATYPTPSTGNELLSATLSNTAVLSQPSESSSEASVYSSLREQFKIRDGDAQRSASPVKTLNENIVSSIQVEAGQTQKRSVAVRTRRATVMENQRQSAESAMTTSLRSTHKAEKVAEVVEGRRERRKTLKALEKPDYYYSKRR